VLFGLALLLLLVAGLGAMLAALTTRHGWLVVVGLGLLVPVVIVTESFDPGRSRDSGEQRVERLVAALRESTAVIEEIQAEVERRSRLARRLEDDVARHRELLEMDQDKVEAVAQTLRIQLREEGRRGFVMNLALSAFLFGLGVLVTLVLH
jgi:hypothetical protein